MKEKRFIRGELRGQLIYAPLLGRQPRLQLGHAGLELRLHLQHLLRRGAPRRRQRQDDPLHSLDVELDALRRQLDVEACQGQLEAERTLRKP
jgi:hypothetical protein